jgi:hypothetical protein
LDDDLAGILTKRARELGMSFKEVVNRTIRAGLADGATKGRTPPPKSISHSFGFKPGIDLDKLNQLADELEADATVESWAKTPRDPSRRQRPRSRS